MLVDLQASHDTSNGRPMAVDREFVYIVWPWSQDLGAGPGSLGWDQRLWTRDQGLGLRPGSGPGVQDLSLGPETLVSLRFFVVFGSGGRKP